MSENQNPPNKLISGWFLLPREADPQLDLAIQLPKARFEGFGITEFDEGYEISFSGLVKINGTSLTGRLIDYYGISTINGEISKSALIFEKRYNSRPTDVIKYAFSKVGDLWVGKFEDRKSSDGTYIFNGQPAQLQFFDIVHSSSVQRKLIKPEVLARC